MKTNSNISISSKGLYSSWCYHQTYRTLFDCGEGCASALDNSLPGIENVFLGHGHGDHVLGLPSLIGCRNAAQGTSRNADSMADHNKPLTIFYPADNDLFNDLFDFCGKRYDHWLRYNLNLVPITAGFELQLGKNIYVRAFDMLHQKRGTTLGFVIYENRKRLKPQYRGLDIPSVLRGGVASADLSEDYRANLFAYCLDAYGIPDAAVQLKDCDLAVMDTTFLDAKDRTDLTHFTLDEATKLCQDVGVKHMVAAHLGTRYDYSDYLFKTDTYTTVIDPNKVYHL